MPSKHLLTTPNCFLVLQMPWLPEAALSANDYEMLAAR